MQQCLQNDRLGFVFVDRPLVTWGFTPLSKLASPG